MDGTSYPPPTPPVPPSGAEPPQASAEVAEPRYDAQAPAPAPEYAPQAPYAPPVPPKKKTGLIIAIVVAVLLLCCCGSGVAGLLFFRASSSEITESSDNVIEQLEGLEDSAADIAAESGNPAGPAEGTGWEDFAPGSYNSTVWIALEPFHQEVLDEVAATLFPDFEITDALVRPSTEYTTDTLLARATLTGEPETQIAFYLEVENTAAFDSGWTDDPADQEFEYLDHGQASNGREYYWDNTQLVPLLNGIGDDKTQELLVTVADDFPDAVITIVETDGETAYVEFTRWDAYPGYETGFSADYSYDGYGWVLDSAQEW